MKSIRLATILFPITFVLISIIWSNLEEHKSQEDISVSLQLLITKQPAMPLDTTICDPIGYLLWYD